MNGRDDDVELRQAVFGKIECAIRTDVALDAGQQRDPVDLA
jgi:hypothetical protein